MQYGTGERGGTPKVVPYTKPVYKVSLGTKVLYVLCQLSFLAIVAYGAYLLIH